MVQIDARNAFNSIKRAVILEQVITHTLSLARWVHYKYGQPPILIFGNHKIVSRTGTQQGDPLSMLLFALALQPLIDDLAATFPQLELNA